MYRSLDGSFDGVFPTQVQPPEALGAGGDGYNSSIAQRLEVLSFYVRCLESLPSLLLATLLS